jgi:hypothetical protein
LNVMVVELQHFDIEPDSSNEERALRGSRGYSDDSPIYEEQLYSRYTLQVTVGLVTQ